MIKPIFSLFLCFLSILHSNALFDSTNTVQKIGTTVDFAKVFVNVDFLTAVIYYRNIPQVEAIAPLFAEFSETNKDFYRFVAVDCDLIDQDENKHVLPACQDEFRAHLPLIVFLEPHAERVDPKTKKLTEPAQHKFEGTVTTEALNSFAEKIMPHFSKTLNSLEDHENFIAANSQLNKVLLLINENTLPPYWKALASRFRDSLAVNISFMFHCPSFDM